MAKTAGEVQTVQCDDNGGCGECACECHTAVATPGPHIASCKFADPDYVPISRDRCMRLSRNVGTN